ncbi:MAG: hypothetical protein JOY90_02925 [Bradyrhizobium sp.]|uniref:hypothetical protein n=1 Tax=Bradyrhizobium sp. TaxID=376 RepID=UPI001DFE667A|nr:hypothetical protein [Bradyrhizobium sp.]MBV9559405.1 hypothetical protein [Bradyrhizobium sp.]
MPAFTFEKISPPANRKPAPPPSKQHPKQEPGLVGRIVNRLSEARAKKNIHRKPAENSD